MVVRTAGYSYKYSSSDIEYLFPGSNSTRLEESFPTILVKLGTHRNSPVIFSETSKRKDTVT